MGNGRSYRNSSGRTVHFDENGKQTGVSYESLSSGKMLAATILHVQRNHSADLHKKYQHLPLTAFLCFFYNRRRQSISDIGRLFAKTLVGLFKIYRVRRNASKPRFFHLLRRILHRNLRRAKCNKFSVRGLVVQAAHVPAEGLVKRLNPAPVPCHLNRMAYRAFYFA